MGVPFFGVVGYDFYFLLCLLVTLACVDKVLFKRWSLMNLVNG
jgi:hypothetical protein